MSTAASLRVDAATAEMEALARLTRGRGGGPMLLGHALCWLGRGAIGAAVRQAVLGRGTMLEEHHRIERFGPPVPASKEWDVVADIAEAEPDRILVRTRAASPAGEALRAEVHLLAIGEARVPPRRRQAATPGTPLREVAFSDADIEAYVALSGDDNALHVDPGAAARAGLRGRAVHGALIAAALEDAVREWAGPGSPGALSARFVGVLLAGEPLTISCRDYGTHDGRRVVRAFGTCGLDLVCTADLTFGAG
jgi:acyl dehydratase